MMKALKKKRKGGFTLIELIVVIAILGILAAIAIPRLGGFSDEAQVSANEATARTIASAVTMAEADTSVTTLNADAVNKFLSGITVIEGTGQNANSWVVDLNATTGLRIWAPGVATPIINDAS